MASKGVQTLVIDNFSGEITPDMIGSLNSGMCPIALTPYGKLPFGRYKNRGLQFMEAPYMLSGSTPLTASLQLGKIFTDAKFPVVYGDDILGNFFLVKVSDITVPTADLDTVIYYTGTVGATIKYGGGIFYDSNQSILVVGQDNGTSSAGTSPLAIANVGTTSFVTATTNFTVGRPRPLAFFINNLYVGNDNHLSQMNSNYSSILTLDVINPPIPSGWTIRDMKVSPDGTYLIVVATQENRLEEFDNSAGQQHQFGQNNSLVAFWNGTDLAYTSVQYFYGINITALAVSSTGAVVFGKDIEGMGIYDLAANKLIGIDDVSENGETNQFRPYPPMPYGIDSIGNFFFFLMQSGNSLFVYMFNLITRKLYCLQQIPNFGSNNGFVPGGLCIASQAGDAVISGLNNNVTKSKIYYFFKDLSSGTAYGYALHLANYGGTVAGNYATQYEEFGRKIRPVSVRIFTYPTVTGVSFNVKLLDIKQNTLLNQTYSFAAGSDLTKSQGSLTKIEMPVKTKAVSELALQIAPNSLSSVFFIDKVEIDYLEDLNPSNS